MRTYFSVIVLLLLFFSPYGLGEPLEDPAMHSEGFREMFDSNQTYKSSVRSFDQKQWEQERGVALTTDQTLRIKISKNVFLKTMAIVNINADAAATGILGVEKILFGVEIRFQGF